MKKWSTTGLAAFINEVKRSFKKKAICLPYQILYHSKSQIGSKRRICWKTSALTNYSSGNKWFIAKAFNYRYFKKILMYKKICTTVWKHSYMHWKIKVFLEKYIFGANFIQKKSHIAWAIQNFLKTNESFQALFQDKN